jgi:hypothetical protein
MKTNNDSISISVLRLSRRLHLPELARYSASPTTQSRPARFFRGRPLSTKSVPTARQPLQQSPRGFFPPLSCGQPTCETAGNGQMTAITHGCELLARRRSLALIHRCRPSLPRMRPNHSRRSFTTNRAGLQAPTWPSPPGSADRLRGDPLVRTDSDQDLQLIEPSFDLR